MIGNLFNLFYPILFIQRKKKFGLDYIMNNKWIVLGIVAVILVILIILIVGVTVSRKPPPTAAPVVTYPAPVAHSLKCGEVVGSWELNNSVAVFKVVIIIIVIYIDGNHNHSTITYHTLNHSCPSKLMCSLMMNCQPGFLCSLNTQTMTCHCETSTSSILYPVHI